ncbi:MAG: Flp pilus assembly complex ATPase component TadA [Bacteriovoracaceae bacterium]|nr:Flp pilus assembly complex ATPase component TadA [Bacteriovoracaceae bacterium]
MFRKEFAKAISATGMIPARDIRPLLENTNPTEISERKLLDFGFFDDVKFARLVAEQNSLTFINLNDAQVSDHCLSLVKRVSVIEFRCYAVQKTVNSVTLAIYDPSILERKNELSKLYQCSVEFIVTNLSSWFHFYDQIIESVDELVLNIKEIGLGKDEKQEGEKIKEDDIGEDVINYVNLILAEAFVKKVSDIHLEPYENFFRIRFRIDGTLQEWKRPPKSFTMPIISRLKIMSQMDISERRKPQDGRIKLEIGGQPIDFRVSALPTLFGEKIVIRLLDSTNLQLDMTVLGFSKKQLKAFQEGIYQPYGMCLVTGPTGSGKTTTLYSGVSALNKEGVNISTAEDPVEFNLMGVNQVNVRKEIGLNFAAALKSFLRQDPDIIMVGEIRDFETAEIAVEAALTGHLVLSTLHTNDAPSTVTRLLNMGLEPFLLTGALNVVVAQRLCRRICTKCKAPDKDLSLEEIINCGISENSAKKIKIMKGKGCATCHDTGYKGRVAIYEVMPITPGIKEIMLKNGTADELKLQAIKEGMKTLRMSALIKVANGLTTLSEAVSNSASDKF